jgi:hypothetical protein
VKAIDYLKRVFSNGHVICVLLGSLSIGFGCLLEYQGVKTFPYAAKTGRASSGSPDFMYWLGGITIAGALISALLFHLDGQKEQQKSINRAANQRQRLRRAKKKARR